MFKHNILIIFRNFKRNKTTFLINLIGLSTGLACALLIYLWVSDEINVDKFHAKDGRLYQVMQNYPLANGILTIEATPGNLADALVAELPDIEETVSATTLKGDRGGQANKGILSADNRSAKAAGIYVSENYFNVFSYELIAGEPSQVLSDQHSVLLSDELAMKLFKTTENLIGKTVNWQLGRHGGDYLISGIFKKPPANSTWQFDLLFNYDKWLREHPHLQDWRNSGPATFVVVKNGADIDRLNSKISNFLPRPVWISRLHRRATIERNRHPQSARLKRFRYYLSSLQRFHKNGFCCDHYRTPCQLFSCTKLAG